MAKKKGSASKPQSSGAETAEQVYAELASQGATRNVSEDVGSDDSGRDAEIVRLREELEQARLRLLDAQTTKRRALDPDDESLDERVLPTETVKGRGGKDAPPIDVHTYRELGIHPDDLDEGPRVNPKTGGIIRSTFIKRSSGNLIEHK